MYKKILLAYDGSDAGQQAMLDCKEITYATRFTASSHLSASRRPAK